MAAICVNYAPSKLRWSRLPMENSRMAVSKTAKAAMGDKGEAGKRFFNGKEVRPVMYVGRHVGHGSYVAGTIDGKLVTNETGVPVKFKQIGRVV